MHQNDVNKVTISFCMLEGMALDDVGHAANMVWIILKPRKSFEKPSNSEVCVDLQCSTQVYMNEIQITGSEDIETLESSRCVFDDKLDRFRDVFKESVLESANMYDDFSLRLQFLSGLTIVTEKGESFEEDEERWRLFLRGPGIDLPHFVVLGDHIEFG